MLDSRRPRALDDFIALDTVLAGISHHRPEKLSSFGIGRLRASGWLAGGIDKHNHHAAVRREGDQPARMIAEILVHSLAFCFLLSPRHELPGAAPRSPKS